MKAASPEALPESPELVALRLAPGMSLRSAPVGRDWMETPAGQYAKRCLPLLMGNQAGWELLNPVAFTAMWDGGPDLSAIRVLPHADAPVQWVTSHFGSGILTWHIPYLFRTPPGFNLLVRGPANSPKDGIGPLEGIVETDWTAATFTMNWKFTRRGHPVVFQAFEPIAMLVPMRRGELERFRPVVRDATAEPATLLAFQQFSYTRQAFLRDIRTQGSAAERAGWQRDYMLGRNTDGTRAPEHQTRLQLAAFATEHPPGAG
jgi:hypothetical protein